MNKIEKWKPELSAYMIALYGKEYFQEQLDGWFKALTEYEERGYNETVRESHKLVKAPTLIIHGDKDSVIGVYHARLVHKNVKNSRYNCIQVPSLNTCKEKLL